MSKLRKALFVALPLAAAGALWFGRETPKADAALPPAIARPHTLVAPSRVEPVRDPVALAFEAGGRIVAIDVDEGDSVRAGQVVARLDDRMAKARVAAAQAAERGHDVQAELALYLIHGLLHLCGYDDHEAADRRAMRERERHYLKLLGLPDSTPNPHLWYAPRTMPKVAQALATDLSAIDPAHAAYFANNAKRFDA